jgi:nucleoid-associated protein YgaU
MADENKPAENPFAQYHVVVRGDTLSKIAEHYYGDGALYPKIFEANRDLIKNPDLIQIGWKLRIP